MKDNIVGVLALGDHLIDRVADRANRALESDWFWITLVVLILLATIAVAMAQIDMATTR